MYIADALGNQVRMVAFGSSSASVTVGSFATVQPGRTATSRQTYRPDRRRRASDQLFPRRQRRREQQSEEGELLALDGPGANGKVKKIAIRRVIFTASGLKLSVFPGSKLVIGNPLRTYRLIVRGQSFGTLTIIFNKWKILSETV